jgi:hypothetical protein
VRPNTPACSRSSRAQTEWNVAAVTPHAMVSQQVSEPQPELACRADTERDREDLPRPREAAGEQVRSSVRQRVGLAGARPGQQQQRAGAKRHGLRLLGGQPREQALGPGRHVIAHTRPAMR